MSVGMIKFYRVAVQESGGFVRQLMWDGIDCHRARMLGWIAESVHPSCGASFDPSTPCRWRLRWPGVHAIDLISLTGFRQIAVGLLPAGP
jgi:hypothetical protein